MSQSVSTLPGSPLDGAPEMRVRAPRSYLLFVRAGEHSLHRRLIAESPERNWDCCVSWYVPPPDERIAEYYSSGGFNKLDGFLEFWNHRPQPWPYRFVLILDDDLYLRPGELSYFFELCERHGTYLSQPALRWFTHTTLNIFVRNPVCLLRRVSTVEVMAPCFSTAALEQLIHTFAWTRATWGTDWAWACLLEGNHALHVVDAVAMEHTRTGDGRPTAFYKRLQAMGIDPAQELDEMRRAFPGFGGRRVLRDGHVFRSGVPRRVAPWLMVLFEKLKVIVRMRKQLLRTWRSLRARLYDRLIGAR